MSISVIIPAKNEVKNLPLNIIIPAFGNQEPIKEVLDLIPIDKIKKFVNKIRVLIIYTPRKSDEILDLDTTKTSFDDILIIKEDRRGYGLAYQTGFSNLEPGIVATLDADGTYPIELLPDLVHEIAKGSADFISINRFEKYEEGAFSKRNLIGNKILTKMTNFLFKLRIKDSQSGMWIFKSELLEKMDLKSKGMEFSTEIKIEAWGKSSKFVEIPGYYRNRIDGGIIALNPWRDGMRIVRYLFNKRFKTLFMNSENKN